MTMTDNHIDKALHDVMERRADKVPALSDDFADKVMGKMNVRKEQQQHRASTPLHHGRGWGWVLSIAAVLFLAFILWPNPDVAESPSLATNEMSKQRKEKKEAQPVIVQQANQEHLLTVNKKDKTDSHKGIDEPLKEKIAGLTIVPTSANLGAGVKMRLGKHVDTLAHKGVDEPLLEKIASLTIVPTSADLGPGNKMRLGPPCPIPAGVEPLPEEDASPIPTDKQALADIYLAEEALQVAYELRAQQEAIRAYAASLAGEDVPKPVVAY